MLTANQLFRLFIFGLLYFSNVCMAFLRLNQLKSQSIGFEHNSLYLAASDTTDPYWISHFQSPFYNEDDFRNHTNLTLKAVHKHLSKPEVCEVYRTYEQIFGPLANTKSNSRLDNNRIYLEFLLDTVTPMYSVDGYTSPLISIDILEEAPELFKKKIAGYILNDLYQTEFTGLSWESVCRIAFDYNLIELGTHMYQIPPIRLLLHLTETQSQLESLWEHAQKKFPSVCRIINNFKYNSTKGRLISTLNHLQLFSDMNMTCKEDLKEIIYETEIASSYIEIKGLDQMEIDYGLYKNLSVKSKRHISEDSEENLYAQTPTKTNLTSSNNSIEMPNPFANSRKNIQEKENTERIAPSSLLDYNTLGNQDKFEKINSIDNLHNKTQYTLYNTQDTSLTSGNSNYTLPSIGVKDISYNQSEAQIPLINSPKSPPKLLNSLVASRNAFQELNIKNEAILYTITKVFGVNPEPTAVQKLAIPRILNGKNILFSSQTGTGKTLAFLLPILQKLKHQETSAGYKRQIRSPRCVILSPTRELTIQTLKVIKQFSHDLKISSTAFLGSELGEKKLASFLGHIYDIVVTSPQQLVENLKRNVLSLNHIRFLIIDEVNDIFLDGFEQDMLTILRHSQSQKPQIIMATASPTKELIKSLRAITNFPQFEDLLLQSSFIAPQHIRYTFLSTQGQDKLHLLKDILQPIKNEKVIVFCNTIQSCRACEHFIKELGKASVGLHGKIPPKLRMNNFCSFAKHNSKILVTTDICSRGLDLEDIEIVILFDFPRNPIDFLHRIGRTGRMYNSGKVISLIAKQDKTFALAIQKAIKQGSSLENLSSYKSGIGFGRYYVRTKRDISSALTA